MDLRRAYHGIGGWMGAAALWPALSASAMAATTVGPKVVGNPGVYNYSPSIIQNGAVQQFWWCGQGANPNDPSQISDSIQYESIDLSTGAIYGPVTVLGETPGAWDAAYTCNPKVVKGAFTNPLGNGSPYTYALYYVGTDDPAGTGNDIGVAFSNDGIHWDKYPQPVITHNPNDSNYGVAQPAAYNSNGASAITLLYEVDYPSEAHLYATSTDGIHFTPQGALTTNGLNQAGIAGQASYSTPTWGDAAYDDQTDEWYAVFNMNVRNPATVGGTAERGQIGCVIYKIAAASLLTGATPWQQVFNVDTNLTGFESNFISGFLRDSYGNVNVSGTYPMIEVYTSASIPQPPWSASPSARGASADIEFWNIAWTIWMPGAPLLPLKRYFNGVTHEVTTGYIDPLGGFNLESTLGYLYESPRSTFTTALYGCQAGLSYFVSQGSDCEGQIFLGIQGYISAVANAGLVPLYRCYTGTDHFVSTDPGCEGTTTESRLGYAAASP